MDTVISRILKIELFILFLITAFSSITFYYSLTLADNYLVISSKTDSINLFTYYGSSIVVLVGYFSGPWTFFPFLLFSLLYSFLYSKRENVLDIFNVLTLSFASLFFTYLFFPKFLGEGILYLLKERFSLVNSFFIFLFLLILFLFCSFRASPKEVGLKLLNFILKVPQRCSRVIRFINPISPVKKLKSSINNKIKTVSNKIPSYLRGTDENNEFDFDTIIADSNKSEIKNLEKENILKKKKIFELKFKSKKKNELTTKDFTKITPPKEKLEDYQTLVSGMIAKTTSRRAKDPDQAYFEKIITSIEDKLGEFRVDGLITEVLKGPVVDTFLLELGKGVKVSRVNTLADDLSGALYGAPIRIVYPMKGRTSVGIEVPRSPRDLIYLDEVLASEDFQKSNYNLPLAMGKDAFGQPFTVDLSAMPHMLVAGATGAGKSVFINSLLVSLLVKRSPTEMKLILIDPKQLELALYAKLPHLCMPVLTDAKTASLSLMWAVQEMDRRYSILKEFGVRNLDSFNKKLKTDSGELISKITKYYDSSSSDFSLPSLVIIVDEFADLILTKAGKEIENNICRLAGKARAAGIHMIVATQRPSVDVITGLIKSNFPTRVSFKVTTSTDSRTILNCAGAEKLLGKGDMLYKRGVETSRVHSSYVDEEEINALVTKLSEMGFEYNNEAVEFLENGGEPGPKDPYSFGSHLTSTESAGEDNLYDNAVEVVMEYRAASASMLQRRLKIGYNRAANLIEKMEAQGIVGPAQGSKPRKILQSMD